LSSLAEDIGPEV